MNKYSEFSDFEVNKLVAERKKINIIEWKGMKQIIFDDDGVGVNLDYCKNWADAGPLMVENRISLGFRDSAGLNPMAVCDNFYAVNANPCRAIAECYLMMTEGEE